MNDDTYAYCEQNYQEIRHRARIQLRKECWTNTYQATELANDVVLRLYEQRNPWKDEGSFLAALNETIRRVLVDRARGKNTVKRPKKNRAQSVENAKLSMLHQGFANVEVQDLIDRYAQEICPQGAMLLRMHLKGSSRAEIMAHLDMTFHRYRITLQVVRHRIKKWLATSSCESRMPQHLQSRFHCDT